MTHMHESIEVDTCPRCHGVWLDQGEMEQILRLHRVRAGLEKPGTANKVVNAAGTADMGLAAADVGFLGEIGEAGTAVVEFLGGLF